MSQPLSIRLDPALDARLAQLAKKTGRTKSFYVKQAIQDQIEDLEDLFLARRVATRVASGKERLIPLDKLEGELAVED
jgi:RHH-type rel operon transcriptional repressor/antitoxin RelB